MNKYFEKIIEGLEKLGWVFAEYYPDGTAVHKQSRKSVAYEDVVEIVNQVAEEYKDNEMLSLVKMNADFQKAKLDELRKIQKEYIAVTNVGHNDGWIPFTEREADKEERIVYGCDMILDCKLPDEDEEILVTYKNGYVDTDTFMRDGYECYLDSGAEFVTKAIAWMPKPKGYQPKGE